jgi:hypothetical protein
MSAFEVAAFAMPDGDRSDWRHNFACQINACLGMC